MFFEKHVNSTISNQTNSKAELSFYTSFYLCCWLLFSLHNFEGTISWLDSVTTRQSDSCTFIFSNQINVIEYKTKYISINQFQKFNVFFEKPVASTISESLILFQEIKDKAQESKPLNNKTNEIP